MQTIYPKAKRHPYYIVSTPYTRMSAGIKVLHLLCHALNLRGENAFITTAHTNPDLLTPSLTDKIIEQHFADGLSPIAVYPEVIIGNPTGAPTVVRYVLNFPGLLGGEKIFAPSEVCFGYSSELIAELDSKFRSNVLFVPASDTSIYFPPEPNVPRKGTCFYAGKYQSAHHEVLLEITKDSVEIHGPLSPHRSQSPNEIAELFRKSELFYCYENSALAIEAALCGCPVVFLPNKHLTRKIGNEQLGDLGMAWGADTAEVARAQATVGDFPARYAKLVENFWVQLENFVLVTKKAAQGRPYTSPFLPTHISVEEQVGSEMRVPKTQTGKLIVLALLIARLLQVIGPIKIVSEFGSRYRSSGKAGLKAHIKMLYYTHFDWIRSRLI